MSAFFRKLAWRIERRGKREQLADELKKTQ